MSTKKGKLPPLKKTSVVMRSVGISSGISDVVIATETPVRRYDEDRGYVINEVLLMDGVVLRANQSQIPIVDSHDDRSVRNIFGSIRQMQVIDGELHGVPSFASDAESQVIRTRMDEGHITDFSITAVPVESLFVPHGQSYTTKRGAVIDGPAVIHVRWQPHNASICATGADEHSTVRRSYTDLERKVTRMDEALLGSLAAMGLPDGMTDPNQILAWVVGKLGTSAAAELPEPVENMDGMTDDEKPLEDKPPEEKKVENMDGATDPEEDKKKVEEAIGRALRTDAKRRKEIQALCTVHKIERSVADSLCDDGVDLNTARTRILERMANKPAGQSTERVNVAESADDKLFAAARDGLIMRTLRASGMRNQTLANPAAGHQDFTNMKLGRVAEMYAEKMGCDVRRMAAKDIALVAMGHPGSMNRFRIQRDAYHTTGSFSNLLLDAANKTLLAGYEEAPFTWGMWARDAGTTADFKNINRIRFSEMGTPEMVPEGKEYKDAGMSDTKETYKINKYGNMFTVTWETVVNDDLDAISRIPAMQGAACRRLQNQAVYSVLTANAAMADTGLLFNATAQTTAGGHSNYATGAGAPSVTTLNTAFISMMTKKGIRSDVILNIQPAFLIVPAAISATALQLLGSIADPSVGGSAAGNSNTKNIYGPNGDRPLKVIVEPLLDANSSTAWYLAASNSQVDTVEITFLEGEQSPVLENEWDFDKDVYKYKVRQTFGVAPIDFRGLYKHNGA
jgi:hypothetical protein